MLQDVLKLERLSIGKNLLDSEFKVKEFLHHRLCQLWAFGVHTPPEEYILGELSFADTLNVKEAHEFGVT